MSLSDAIPQVLGRRIAISPTGYHVIPWTAKQGSDGSLPGQLISVWQNEEDFTVESIDWPNAFVQPETVFVAGRLVIADVVGGIGPVQVREYDRQNQKVFDWQYGDTHSRVGCSCRTPNGGALFINFATWDVNAPEYGFDLAYRVPVPPPALDMPSTSGWTYKRIMLHNLDPGTVTSPMDCVCVGNTVYVFHGFDGSGRWDLLKIKLDDLSYEHVVAFIGRGSGDVAPCLEIPYITAMLDKIGNRILLAYQNVHQTPTNCPGGSQLMAYPTSIVAVSLPNLVASLLFTLPWDCFHSQSGFPVPVWARPDGYYFPSIKRTNCDTSLALYRFDGTIHRLVADIPNGTPRAFSPDGWFIYQDPSEALPYITTLFPMAPVLSVTPHLVSAKIAKAFNINSPGIMEVAWDNFQEGDILESSTDLKTWQTVVIGQRPPVDVNMTTDQQNFRIRRVVSGS